jgi:CRISPR system Cascade subunit CasC
VTIFVQFHLLTPYPPSNPNRDDQGRPKQAMIGGHPRLRLSSQSLKRAVRETAFFAQDLAGQLGTRTKRIAQSVEKHLLERGVEPQAARLIGKVVARGFSKLETKKSEADAPPLTTTLAFVSPDEWRAAYALAEVLSLGDPRLKPLEEVLNNIEVEENKLKDDSEAKDSKKIQKLRKDEAKILKNLIPDVLRKADGAVDIAMFGRMLADDPDYNREAAVQVSHAITTHRAHVEDDFFIGADDLKTREEDAGAGHLGETGFGSGVYYLYACVNTDLLVENLAGDRALARKGIEALAKALATATPRGKQNSFAHHPRAHYVRVERGPQQPRDLSGAFFRPIPLSAPDLVKASIDAMESMAAKIDHGYGPSCEAHAIFNLQAEEGSLAEIAAFAAHAIADA